MSAPRMHNDDPGPFRVDLQDIRRLEIRYSRARPNKVELAVEYIGGRVRAFVADRFLIERLLDQLDERET